MIRSINQADMEPLIDAIFEIGRIRKSTEIDPCIGALSGHGPSNDRKRFPLKKSFFGLPAPVVRSPSNTIIYRILVAWEWSIEVVRVAS